MIIVSQLVQQDIFIHFAFCSYTVVCRPEMEMGQWVMGHGSNGSPFLDGSRGSWVIASDPLTHDDEITAQ